LAVLGLILAGCFQAVDTGETFIEKGTAHLRVNNASADEAYVLEGLELRNAEGAVEQSWEGLDLAAGDTWEVHTETEGSFTLMYRVKDTWISDSAIDLWEGGPVEIALNRSHEFLFRGEDFEVSQEDADGDGLPDTWEKEHGLNPEDPADGNEVYVSAGGQDEAPGNGTRASPYKTLAKAADRARQGLTDTARTVVVLGELDWQSGNPPDPEDRVKSESLFALGKTRNPLTIRGEDPAAPGKPGVLRGYPGAGKRVLYLGPGADITLLNMTITGGKHTGGGIYASGAKLTLGPGTTITGNESYDVDASGAGGIYMERGVLVMEPGSSVSDNTAHSAGGVNLVASVFTMKGGKITGNRALRASGGLSADGSTLEMFAGAEISGKIVGKPGSPAGDNAGGLGLVFSTLTMHQGSKITGNKVYSGFGGGLYVTGESTLIMKGSEISGNECTVESVGGKADDNAGWGGGLEMANTSSLVMESGSINGNKAVRNGGGVYLLGESSFTMQGGDISNNKMMGDYGGGICIDQSSLFTLTGGSVKNNTAKGNGGGIAVGTGTFTMKGGDITGNTAKAAGGGVFLEQGASFNMTSGEIAQNTAKTLGGGIYMRGYDRLPTGDITFKPAAVFTMAGGHVYGKTGAKANTVNDGDTKGHAIYTAKSPGANSVSRNDEVTIFP
jgi:predicted outer membrane repeat protein